MVVTLTAGLIAPAAARSGATGEAGGSGPGSGAAGAQRVTLITGDHVVVARGGEVTGLVRAEGRESVPVRIMRIGDATHVIPQDVMPLIADGTLDQRLFNVTELSREQYRSADGLPLIVTYSGRAARADAAQAELYGAAGDDGTTTLNAINGEALTVQGDEITAVWEALTGAASGERTLAATPGIATIALDGIATKTLDESVAQIGAPEAWEAGYDGEGATIAVLDTGISAEHPDLAGGKVIAEQNFSDAADAEDRDGHGTHVASTAAGTGAHSDGRYSGVAPGANLINGKVLDDYGSGWESDIIEGMQWAVDQGADVVSMSLGGFAGPEIDPMEQAVNTLSAESDALFVIAAGNSGPEPGTIGSPGTADAALTLGAVDKSDVLADFSSVGPRSRDGGLKPDVTAPGVDITAAGAEGASIWEYGTPAAEDGYVAISGTSMATPHAAGAAALLAQAHPDWTGEQIKSALTGSAVTGEGYGAFQQGAGRIDVPAAIEQTVIAEQSSLSFGTVPWPHEDADPVTRELTYRNLDETDVTLQLDASGLDPEGNAAPEGMFTLGADEVTVPAGGTATVEVSADTSVGGDVYGAYSLYLTATGDGGESVTTAGAVEREERMFELTVDVTDRSGAPATDWWATVIDAETFQFYDIYGDEGTSSGSVRLPAGEYQVETNVVDPGEEDWNGLDWLVAPNLALTEDTTLDADARDAEAIEMTVADTRAEQTDLTVGYRVVNEDAYSFDSSWSAAGLPGGFRTAQIGEGGGTADISGYASTTWERGNRQYYSVDTREDSFYTGLTDHIGSGDFARITTREGASLPGQRGVLFTFSSEVGSASAMTHELPHTTEVYVEAGTGQWSQEFMQENDEVFASAGGWTDYETYRPRIRYAETFNVGVFGPAFGPANGLFRTGDVISGWISPFSDGEGHLGYSVVDSSQTILYRDGEVYATAEDIIDYVEFEVPSDEAEYELVTTASRDPEQSYAAADVSTEVTAAYTFTSAGVGEEETVSLPASAVRFTPRLNDDSTAAARRTVDVPVTVQGSAAGRNLDSLTVSVSYDHGRTWTDVEVKRGKIRITNPKAGRTVSFRAEVEDKQGNTLTQTIIDAYRTV
ncbi:S8 family serine peptidase [Streptomyces sp. NBC_01803]|uniref:S8 family serine peptidase n=1 Tax=Streptomyces sp. NBC_01803 TaxID=2975946 RepID=UPI002DD92C99|nr:S8 family serine peptidase [Streptomyces sp. NBC_01803]WSA44883.1 S8 family serine peptidase [Streptomyces sp. NBC_01803]